jgi:GNAT superfamily N-acetyltransferase
MDACHTESGEVVGCYTLSTLSISPTSLPDALIRRLPRYEALPAILLGRLAVDRRRRGQGLGGMLLVDALRRCRTISGEVGTIGVVVDAKGDEARAFYEHFGFVRFSDRANRLFLPMASVEQL